MKLYSPRPSLPVFILCLTLAMALLQGCATLRSGFEEPTITVADLRIREIKAFEATFLLELRIMNPNDFALDLNGLNCALNVEGNHLATGISNERQEIPAYGNQTVTIMVYASTVDVVGSLIQLLQGMGEQQRNPLQYELTGKIRLNGYGTIPFNSKGQLDADITDR
jgi:LEA14-like dessication related protein